MEMIVSTNPFDVKIGRPPGLYKQFFTQERGDDICNFISNGGTLIAWCRKQADGIKPNKVRLWARGEDGAPQSFVVAYARARLEAMDHYADEIVEIADTTAVTAEIAGEVAADSVNDPRMKDRVRTRALREEVAANKERIETRKWLMSRLNRQKYGDRIGLDHGGADKPVKLDISKFTTEQLEKLSELQSEVDDSGS